MVFIASIFLFIIALPVCSMSLSNSFSRSLLHRSLSRAISLTTSKSSYCSSSSSFSPSPSSPSSIRSLPLTVLSEEESDRANRLLSFIDTSPDPFHAVQSVTRRLVQAGFTELRESDEWHSSIASSSSSSATNPISPGGKYFFVRDGSSVVAFSIGKQFVPGNGFKILAAHTDSPNLKIKPVSGRGSSTSGVIQLNVECYGGGLWHTWFDRDLSVSGRVVVREADNSFSTRLVKIDRPILRIPNLCIHLKAADERDIFKFNKEDHLQPILCDAIARQLSSEQSNSSLTAWAASQEPLLLKLLADYLDCKNSDVVDFDLSLFDVQAASRTGMMSEYICGSRLDNLASCFTIVESFVDHSNNFNNDAEVSVMALFDHEEVGSQSNVGAGSNLLMDIIDRLSGLLHVNYQPLSHSELVRVSKAKSFIMSVDMAHALHANYAQKHDRHHAPLMNSGIVVKSNSNQKYATSGISGFLVREMGRIANINLQEFAVRNDCPCGSTIGPIISSATGIRAVDVGMPQLSMHSIREMMGCKDLTNAHRLFTTFLQQFSKLDTHFR